MVPVLWGAAGAGVAVFLVRCYVPEAAGNGIPHLKAVLHRLKSMGAYFTAVVRASLTGIVLIVEMTGNYSLVLPLLVARLTAYGLADYLGDSPNYEALLERDLLRGQANPELEGALLLELLELPVHPGAPSAGRAVRHLGLPPGCVLVTLRRGSKEEVPTAGTRLHSGDRITAVVGPNAADAVPLLREGTSAP